MRRENVAIVLEDIVGPRRVLKRPSELVVYSADGLPSYRKQPSLAVFPETRAELIDVVRALAAIGAPFVPRGAGTGLSGGALADDVVLLCLNRLNRILRVDPANALAVVEPGVVNVTLTREASKHGLHYAPDPSSQAACTIGGNVAENAGGPHCLKYGVTLNHIAAVTAILPDGEIVRLGNATGETDGYDLLGAFVGSEGCFGVALEMMDAPTVRAVEASIYAAGYPTDAEAVLLAEVDGLPAGLDADVRVIERLCMEAGARTVKVAADDAERARLWQGRKKAFGAMGRISPHLVVQDAVIPRTRLPEVLARIHEISGRYRVKVCNVFHAGDGNLHPNIGYDATDPDETVRVHAAMREIMQVCIDAGGTITGEHGVGLDKLEYMDLIFSPDSLAAMCQLRDVFDPERRSNPGKVVPVRACREWQAARSARSA